MNKILKWLHVHNFNKPIISMYTSFSYRDIIYECGCGERKCYHVYKDFGDAFPINTTNLLTQKEFNKYLNKEL